MRIPIRPRLNVFAFVPLLVLAIEERARAQQVAGAALVLDAGQNALVLVEPLSGNRSVVSGGATGSGIPFSDPTSLAVESQDSALVTDRASRALIRVDTTDGSRTILSGGGAVSSCTGSGVPFACCTGSGTGNGAPPCDAIHGTGESLKEPFAVAVEADGSILVADDQLPSDPDYGSVVFRIDPSTGNRTVMSNELSLGFFCQSAGVPLTCCTGFQTSDGTPPCTYVGLGGWPSGYPAVLTSAFRDLALEADGTIAVTEINGQQGGFQVVFRLYPTDGYRFVWSASGAGSGPLFLLLSGMAVRSNGDIIVADRDGDALFRVDPVTRNRTIISTGAQASDCAAADNPFDCCTGAGTGDGTAPCAAVGTGQGFIDPDGVTETATGDLLVADAGLDAVVRVDPATGNRSFDSVLNGTASCTGAGTPFACCTGAGTGNGTAPCASVGSGTGLSAPVDVEYVPVPGIRPGDILVVDSGLDAVVRVDPTTGDRTVFSSAAIGGGPTMLNPGSIGWAWFDHILVGEPFQSGGEALFRIDPATGSRVIVSDQSTGSGEGWQGISGIAARFPGPIMASDVNVKALFVVHPDSGYRAIASTVDQTFRCTGAGNPFDCCTGSLTGNETPPCGQVGTGLRIHFPVEAEMEPDKDVLVGDNELGALLRIGKFPGGNRSVLSAADQSPRCQGSDDPIDCCTGSGTGDGTAPCVAAGTGPELPGAQGIAVDAQTGDIFVGGTWMLQVDPVSGNRTVVSSSDITLSHCTGGGFGEIDPSCCTGAGTSNGTPPCADLGTGPAFDLVSEIDLDGRGNILAIDTNADAVIKVDRTTGNRTILSNSSNGTGVDFDSPLGIAVVPGETAALDTGNDVSGSVLGGTGRPGGVDFEFDEVTGPGAFSVVDRPEALADLMSGLVIRPSVNFYMLTNPVQRWTVTFEGEFSGMATLTFHYSDEDLFPGMLETDLKIHHEVGSSWVVLPTISQNTTANTITVQTSSFSDFVLGGGQSTLASLALSGTAQGGTIEVMVGGVFLSLTTTAAQSASTVATALASLINGDAVLSAAGVTATANDGVVTVSDSVFTYTAFNDPGISGSPAEIPTLSAVGTSLFLVLLVLAAAVVLRRRSRPVAR